MSLLLLLRHARSGWAPPGMSDFDRPLDENGRDDAAVIGAAMLKHDYRPKIILCSPAVRAKETLACAAAYIDTRDTVYLDALYTGDANGYLDAIRNARDAESVLVVGHNPMMEDVSVALAGAGSDVAKATLAGGFPTSGLAAIRFPSLLAMATLGGGYLEVFLTPGSV